MTCDIHSGEFDECDCFDDDRHIPDHEEIEDYTRIYDDERPCVHPPDCEFCNWCGFRKPAESAE